MKRIQIILLITVVATTVLGLLTSAMRDARSAVLTTENNPATATIDYPLNGSIFPPEITPPTFIWRDAAEASHVADRDHVCRWLGSNAFRFRRPPFEHWRNRSTLYFANNELPKLTPDAGSRAHLDSGCEDLGKDQETLCHWPGAGDYYRLQPGRSQARDCPAARFRFRPQKTRSEHPSFTGMCH